ncbi:MAG: hypothetical protein ACP5JE_06265, partial [Thermoplasmata archaeon]
MGESRIKTFIFPIVFVLMLICPVFGNQYINNAVPYAQINWRCNTPNTDIEFDFRAGVVYPGEAYWLSGNDSIDVFRDKISNGYVPGGYELNAANRAGIDCSAFVSRAWGISRHGTSTLSNVSRLITRSQLQAGDILNWANTPGHVYLFSSFDSDPNYINVYHAKGTPGSNPNEPVNSPARGKMVMPERIPWPPSHYLPRRRGLTAPVSCNISNEATWVSRRPTIVVQFNGELQAST